MIMASMQNVYLHLCLLFSKENLSYDHMSTVQTLNRLKAPKDKMYLSPYFEIYKCR